MNRAPGTVWGLRYPGTYPNGHVRTTDDDEIEVGYYHGFTERYITLPRRDARLLAKRINQCLDKTTR